MGWNVKFSSKTRRSATLRNDEGSSTRTPSSPDSSRAEVHTGEHSPDQASPRPIASSISFAGQLSSGAKGFLGRLRAASIYRSPRRTMAEKKKSQAAVALEEKLKDVAPATRVGAVSKQPQMHLENGRDWQLEYYTSSPEPLVVSDTKMHQKAFIRECKGVNVRVEKKINSVILERCEKVNCVVDNVISSIEFIHCKKCKIQILGIAPSVVLDNCEGVEIYSSLASRSLQIATSLCADLNLYVPKSKEDVTDLVEIPIPSQFVHSLKSETTELETKVSDLYR